MKAALSVLACFALAACNPVCGGKSSGATGTGWKLTLSGPAAGTLSSGTSDCQAFTASKHFGYGLNGQLDSKQVVLSITVYSNFTGQGTYKVGSVLDGAGELRLQVGSYVGSTTTGAGALTVNPDGRSGTVDADLPQGEHVKGSWTCDKYESLSG